MFSAEAAGPFEAFWAATTICCRETAVFADTPTFSVDVQDNREIELDLSRLIPDGTPAIISFSTRIGNCSTRQSSNPLQGSRIIVFAQGKRYIGALDKDNDKTTAFKQTDDVSTPSKTLLRIAPDYEREFFTIHRVFESHSLITIRCPVLELVKPDIDNQKVLSTVLGIYVSLDNSLSLSLKTNKVQQLICRFPHGGALLTSGYLVLWDLDPRNNLARLGKYFDFTNNPPMEPGYESHIISDIDIGEILSTRRQLSTENRKILYWGPNSDLSGRTHHLSMNTDSSISINSKTKRPTAASCLTEARIEYNRNRLLANGSKHLTYMKERTSDVKARPFEPIETEALRTLAGHISIITGAASGIGRATAELLVQAGAHVVAVDKDEEALKRLRDYVHLTRPDALRTFVGDVTEVRVVESFFEFAIRSYGGIDSVVSSAGAGGTKRLADMSDDEWRATMDLNATAHFLVTRSALTHFRTQMLGGSLVYVASKVALAPGLGFGAYAISKAAELQLARVAAIEGGEIGVRSNIVNPGALFEKSNFWTDEIQTERAEINGIEVDRLSAHYIARNLLKKPVTCEDVANAIQFLVSDKSSSTSGCILTVDGGSEDGFPR